MIKKKRSVTRGHNVRTNIEQARHMVRINTKRQKLHPPMQREKYLPDYCVVSSMRVRLKRAIFLDRPTIASPLLCPTASSPPFISAADLFPKFSMHTTRELKSVTKGNQCYCSASCSHVGEQKAEKGRRSRQERCTIRIVRLDFWMLERAIFFPSSNLKSYSSTAVDEIVTHDH